MKGSEVVIPVTSQINRGGKEELLGDSLASLERNEWTFSVYFKEGHLYCSRSSVNLGGLE